MIWDASSGKWLQTLEIAKSSGTIPFDLAGSNLHTEIRVIALGAS